jgi:hypothetical protein
MLKKMMMTAVGGLATLLVAMGPAQATAGYVQGKIDLVEITGSNYAVLEIPGTVTPRVSCQTAGYNNQFMFDVSTSKGKAMFSIALAAYVASRPVQVVGSGSCTNVGFGSLESVSSLIVM